TYQQRLTNSVQVPEKARNLHHIPHKIISLFGLFIQDVVSVMTALAERLTWSGIARLLDGPERKKERKRLGGTREERYCH
ncbi:MAG: hypothetical protein VYA41_04650, partial [Pseudomonadota bacterium]|nr:hypothetical protein [Pseudomonadota bacterium]